MRHIWWVVALAACAHNVPQDYATGSDGRQKGAAPIPFENGEALAKGIVTYPGGDRVDWRRLELPAGKHGTLDLRLTWQSPRPGLQVAFDVFDQWNQPIVATKAAQHRRGRSRTASIDHARGSYFVRIYAPGRGDAGAYKLVASFAEDPTPIVVDPTKLEVSEPPRLPAVPPAEDCDVFEISNKACEKKCPPVGAPAGWPGCVGTPQVGGTAPPVASPPAQPAVVAAPIQGRIIKLEVVSDGTIVTIAAGSDRGVDKTWKGQVLARDTDHALPGGTLTVIRVTKLLTLAKVKLTSDQINENPQVRLSPP